MLNLNGFVITILLFWIVLLANCNGEGLSKNLYQCRQMCYMKFKQQWIHCMNYQDCRNCWNSCDEMLGTFPLKITSASRQGSLILTDIAWDQNITNTSKQCLVTWEVSGGGLMGNLLTDGYTVELSLWADTVYHIQVTCRNKQSGTTRKSSKLIVDTRKLSSEILTMTTLSTTTSTTTTSTTTLDTTTITATATTTIAPRTRYKKITIKTTNEENLQDVFASGDKFKNDKENQDNLEISKTNLNEKTHIDLNDDLYEESINHILSIKQSELKGEHNDNYLDSDYYSKNILYIVIGLIAIIFGIAFIFILLRIIRNRSNVERVELIHGDIFLDAAVLHV